MDPEGDESWVCEASKIEKQYELNHKRGHFLLAYQLSLASVKPLQEDHVKRALIHLRRKCPVLRLCFGNRNGALWLRYRTNQEIDFKVVSGITPEEVQSGLQTYQYNSESGPLWCARLLYDTAEDKYNLDKETFPYTSQFFLGIHHGISDGMTNATICGAFVGILNDVISSKTINDSQQIGQFISGHELENIVNSKIIEIQKEPKLIQELREATAETGIGMPLLMKAFPPPEGEDKTHVYTHVLEATATKKFISKCKAEGVTLHSAYTALSVIGTVKLVADKGYDRDLYKLCHSHAINLRRYMKTSASQVLGCHVRIPIYLWTEIPKDVVGNFWEYTRSLHKEIQFHLKQGTVLDREAFEALSTTKNADFEDTFNPTSPKQVDFVTSNMGDVTGILTEGGPHVKPFFIIRQTSMHNTEIKHFAHMMQTLRGRLIVSLLYNTKFTSKQLVEDYFKAIFGLLEKV